MVSRPFCQVAVIMLVAGQPVMIPVYPVAQGDSGLLLREVLEQVLLRGAEVARLDPALRDGVVVLLDVDLAAGDRFEDRAAYVVGESSLQTLRVASSAPAPWSPRRPRWR